MDALPKIKLVLLDNLKLPKWASFANTTFLSINHLTRALLLGNFLLVQNMWKMSQRCFTKVNQRFFLHFVSQHIGTSTVQYVHNFCTMPYHTIHQSLQTVAIRLRILHYTKISELNHASSPVRAAFMVCGDTQSGISVAWKASPPTRTPHWAARC